MARQVARHSGFIVVGLTHNDRREKLTTHFHSRASAEVALKLCQQDRQMREIYKLIYITEE